MRNVARIKNICYNTKMNNFKDGGFKKGKKDFGGRPKFGGGGHDKRGGFGGERNARAGGGKPELFNTTCSTCRKSCDVPFRPSADKPVYCSACFDMKNKGDVRDDGARRDTFRKDTRPIRSEYQKSPRDYQSAPSGATRGMQDSGLEDMKRQLATIESRLNRILDLISPPLPKVKAVIVDVKRNEGEKLPKKERKPKTVSVKKVVSKVVKKIKK